MKWLVLSAVALFAVGCSSSPEAPMARTPGKQAPAPPTQTPPIQPAPPNQPVAESANPSSTLPQDNSIQDTESTMSEPDYLRWIDGVRNTAVSQLPLDATDNPQAVDMGITVMQNTLATVQAQPCPPPCFEVKDAFTQNLQANLNGFNSYKAGDRDSATSSMHRALQLEEQCRAAMDDSCQRNGMANLWPDNVRFP